MNEKKIAFIICVNQEAYYQECLFYMDQLQVPAGYELEVLPVRNAASICNAYNLAMNQTDAKYKIYMHQDVFPIYENMLEEMVDCFCINPKIGMLGVLGGTEYPVNRRFYKSWNAGSVIACSDKNCYANCLDTEAASVVALDGMLLMTQYDIPWREELSGWDFYDFSQSMEVTQAGYELWVPQQKRPWCLHDCGYLNFLSYDKNEEEFLKLYPQQFEGYQSMPQVYPPDHQKSYQLYQELKEQWKKLLTLGYYREVRESMMQLSDERFFDTEIQVLHNLLEIQQAEEAAQVELEHQFLTGLGDIQAMEEKYRNAKFHLWRQQYARREGEVRQMENRQMEAEKIENVSEVAWKVIRRHAVLEQPDKVLYNRG